MINYQHYCPVFRSSFVLAPCTSNLRKAKELSGNGKRLGYTLEKCVECGGKRLEQIGVPLKGAEMGYGDMSREKVLDTLEKFMEPDGFITKKTLAAHLGIPTKNLDYYLKKMKAEGLIEVEPVSPNNPPRVRWATPAPSSGDMPLSNIPPDAAPPMQDPPVPEEPIFVGNGKEKLPEKVAAQIREKLEPVVAPVPAPVDPPQEVAEVPQAIMCKNHPAVKGYQNGDLCWNCWQRERWGPKKTKPWEANKNGHDAQAKLFQWTLDTMPVFDPAWAQEVWERWHKVWGSLLDMARGLDGVEPDKSCLQEIADGLLEGIAAGAIECRVAVDGEALFKITEAGKQFVEAQ